MTDSHDENPYIKAYPLIAERKGVWREIVRTIVKDAGRPSTIIELGAGYCDFINQFPAEKKIAFDLNPEMAAFAGPDVELHIENAIELPGIADDSIDLVFASNFLEHLDSEEVHRILSRIHDVLRPGGRLILLQPNYRLCAEHYFDDPTHKTIFSDKNIADYLKLNDLRLIRIVPGFLPFSMKSSMPKWSFLVRLYLASPIKPLAAQMYIVAQRR